MSILDLEKLVITYMPPVTFSHPAEGRKYTVTHDDQSGIITVAIGCHYDQSQINPTMRDEVLAEWKPDRGQYILLVTVHVSDGEFDENHAKIRYMIFQRELPLALQAIMHADIPFLGYYPWLLDSPIYAEFTSIYPESNQTLDYGTPRQYL